MPHNALDKKSNFEFLEYVDNSLTYIPQFCYPFSVHLGKCIYSI